MIRIWISARANLSPCKSENKTLCQSKHHKSRQKRVISFTHLNFGSKTANRFETKSSVRIHEIINYERGGQIRPKPLFLETVFTDDAAILHGRHRAWGIDTIIIS